MLACLPRLSAEEPPQEAAARRAIAGHPAHESGVAGEQELLDLGEANVFPVTKHRHHRIGVRAVN
jgi:hypothetical protein